ncbi:hypothetical protein PM082_018722 [Marasmius tenuissimus]|nr:hypothetical protein PM082_018722 [Marasmius tenuissimus]
MVVPFGQGYPLQGGRVEDGSQGKEWGWGIHLENAWVFIHFEADILDACSESGVGKLTIDGDSELREANGGCGSKAE